MFWLKKHYLCLVIIKSMNMRRIFLFIMYCLLLPLMACAQTDNVVPDTAAFHQDATCPEVLIETDRKSVV